MDPISKSYSPAHYLSSQENLASELMKEFELAALISHTPSSLQISHLPLVLSEHKGRECFLGHMAKANPHWKLIRVNSRVTVIFRGPDHYISPAWYVPHDDDVPTWNYAAVHIEGSAELVQGEEETLKVLEEQVNWWESQLGTQWRLNTSLPEIQDAGRAIVAFRIYPDTKQFKFKLRQKQSQENWQNTVRALDSCPTQKAKQIAEWMRKTRG